MCGGKFPQNRSVIVNTKDDCITIISDWFYQSERMAAYAMRRNRRKYPRHYSKVMTVQALEDIGIDYLAVFEARCK